MHLQAEVSSTFSFQRFELNNLKFDALMRDMVEDDPNPLTMPAESVLKIKRVLASTTCWFKNPKIHQTYLWSTLAVLLSNFCCNELLVAGCTYIFVCRIQAANARCHETNQRTEFEHMDI